MSAPSIQRVRVRKARISDVPAVQKLINDYADAGAMLARPLAELYERLRDHLVAEVDGEVAGSCALHIDWADLAEVRSLAVDRRFHRLGIGRKLVEGCIDEARELGIERVYALTGEPEFFSRVGFSQIDMASLPRRIWGECIRCPKFPACDEVAMVYDLRRPDGASA